MDAGKRVRIARIAAIVCLSLAFLNAALAVYAMIDEKSYRSGGAGIAIASSLFIIGMANLVRSKRRPPQA